MPDEIMPWLTVAVLFFQAWNQYTQEKIRREVAEVKILMYRDFVTHSDYQRLSGR